MVYQPQGIWKVICMITYGNDFVKLILKVMKHQQHIMNIKTGNKYQNAFWGRDSKFSK